MNNHRIHREARTELFAAIQFYDRERPGYGRKFLNDFKQNLTLIKDFPFLGRETDKPGIRCFGLKKFEHSILYTIENDVLWILAVGHQSRHPDYWKDRINPSTTTRDSV